MKTGRTRNVFRNITWGMFQRIMSSLFPFATRTVMIYTIGISYVGLSGLFSSVLMVLNLAELGIGNAMVYFMYKPMAEEDVDQVCALLAVYRKCYRCIGAVILTIGLCLFPLLHFLVNGEQHLHGILATLSRSKATHCHRIKLCRRLGRQSPPRNQSSKSGIETWSHRMVSSNSIRVR